MRWTGSRSSQAWWRNRSTRRPVARARRGAGRRRADPPRHPARRMTAPSRAAGHPTRPRRSHKPDPRAQGYIAKLCTERALQGSCAPAHFAGAPRSTARVPADQSARLTIMGPLSGGATFRDSGSGAHSRGTRRAACHNSRSFGAADLAGRVPGATSAGRPAPGDHQRQQSARLLAGQQCAAMARELSIEPELVRHGGASGNAAWREATRLAGGAPRSR